MYLMSKTNFTFLLPSTADACTFCRLCLYQQEDVFKRNWVAINEITLCSFIF